MKKLILSVVLFLAISGLQQAFAQVNITLQPKWGPVGYNYVNYYYLPDIETYYHVPTHRYVHQNPAGKWVYSNGLPATYRNYDLYNGYKVVINQPDAYKYHKDHKIKYIGYKGNKSQAIIKNSKDVKYKVVQVKTKVVQIKPKVVHVKTKVHTKGNKN